MTRSGTDLTAAFLDRAPLVPGDRVRLISPAGPGSAASVARAEAYLQEWGLATVVGDHVLTGHPWKTYLSASDENRRTDLVQAWCDPDAAAVVCLRGGFGSMRLIDGLDWDALRTNGFGPGGRPKLLTGSSDITALHQAFIRHLGVPTLFSPMPGNDVFRDSSAAREDVRRWLFEPWAGRDLLGPRAEVLVPGQAGGRLLGGNLSLLAASVGAPEHLLPDGAIALLEDVDEELYRLDNLMVQLARSGWLAAASGFVLGSWQDCGPSDQVRRLMAEYLGDLGVPVVWEQGSGHHPDAPSSPLGVPVLLDAPVGGPLRLCVGGLG